MLTEEQVHAMVKASTADIERAARESIKASIAREMDCAVQNAVRAAADEYLAEHVKPRVLKMLVENDNKIVEAAVRFARAAGEALSKAMMAEFSKKMGMSYERKKILEAMFG